MTERNYWRQLKRRKLSRRALLNVSARAGIGAAGLALVGCGDDDDDGQPAAVQVEQQEQQEQPQAAQPQQQQVQQQQAQQASEQDAEQQAQQAEQQEQPAAEQQEQQQAAQAQATVADHTPTGEVRWPISGNVSGLEGTTGTGGGDHQVLWPIFDNLVSYDASLTPTESRSLAESWEIPDPLQVIFNIRPGVLYHDLTELSADTTRLHIERGQTLDGSNVKADLAAIARVDPVDETTAIFEMNAPFSPLLRVLGDRAGMLLAPSAFDQFNTPNSREVPVGTGAFVYVDEDLDGPYRQEYFPQYWQPDAPRVAKLTMSQSIEGTQGVNGLLTGEFDFLPGVPPEDLSRVEDAGKSISVRETNALGFIYVNPNLGEPWDNVHLRRAMNHAIDRDKFVEVVYENLNTANHWGYLGPALVGIHDPDEILIRYDPDRVREELELAGHPDGFDFDMNIPATAITAAEFIQASVAPFGINLNIVVKPTPDYYLEFFEKKVNTFMSGMSVRADPWQQLAFLGRADGPYDFMLPPQDKDADVQAAFQKVTEIFEPEARAEAFRELNRVMVSRAWHIHTHYWSSVYAHDPALEFEHFGDGKPHFGQKDVRWVT
ncbi:MAG: ABC transporter substrate-binding protein [Chloroflexota bacterium]|nr:ABC transporter substrate-binding protein [Chloroflexota bacterium]